MANIPFSDPKSVLGLAEGAAVGAGEDIGHLRRMADWGRIWMQKAGLEERFAAVIETLRAEGAPEEAIRILEAEGPDVLKKSPNKLGKALWAAAGTKEQKAMISETLSLARQYPKGVPPAIQKKYLDQALSLAKKAGVPEEAIADLRKTGPKVIGRFGAARVLSSLEAARPETLAAKMWAFVLQKGKPGGWGKRRPALTAEIKSELARVQGFGVAGEPTTAVGKAARRAGVTRAGALPPPEPEILGAAGKRGVKGLGKVSRGLRGLGKASPMIGAALLGWGMYDSLVGKKKRARAILEASRGGTGQPLQSLETIREILAKRDAIARRRVMLNKDPDLMNQIIQALAGQVGRGPLTRSEMALGTAATQPAQKERSPEEMKYLMDQLLGEMEGM
jgi:hypothetical protein